MIYTVFAMKIKTFKTRNEILLELSFFIYIYRSPICNISFVDFWEIITENVKLKLIYIKTSIDCEILNYI